MTYTVNLLGETSANVALSLTPRVNGDKGTRARLAHRRYVQETYRE
jgi:hypothetical protein